MQGNNKCATSPPFPASRAVLVLGWIDTRHHSRGERQLQLRYSTTAHQVMILTCYGVHSINIRHGKRHCFCTSANAIARVHRRQTAAAVGAVADVARACRTVCSIDVNRIGCSPTSQMLSIKRSCVRPSSMERNASLPFSKKASKALPQRSVEKL